MVDPSTVAALLIAPAWFAGTALVQESAPEPAATPAVTVALVQLQAIEGAETFTGRIEAVARIDLLASVSGFIQSVGFKEGQNVSKGDTLFKIEPDP